MEELGRIVPQALKQHLKRDQAPLLAVIAGMWSRVAGKAIADQARPAAFSGGALTLVASGESWVIQLQALSAEICAAVNHALGQPLVKRLRVRHAGATGTGPGRLSVSAKSPETSGRGQGWIESQAAAEAQGLGALDPETRRILAQSVAKYFGRLPQRTH